VTFWYPPSEVRKASSTSRSPSIVVPEAEAAWSHRSPDQNELSALVFPRDVRTLQRWSVARIVHSHLAPIRHLVFPLMVYCVALSMYLFFIPFSYFYITFFLFQTSSAKGGRGSSCERRLNVRCTSATRHALRFSTQFQTALYVILLFPKLLLQALQPPSILSRIGFSRTLRRQSLSDIACSRSDGSSLTAVGWSIKSRSITNSLVIPITGGWSLSYCVAWSTSSTCCRTDGSSLILIKLIVIKLLFFLLTFYVFALAIWHTESVFLSGTSLGGQGPPGENLKNSKKKLNSHKTNVKTVDLYAAKKNRRVRFL